MSDDLKTRIRLYRQHNAQTARSEAVLPGETISQGDTAESDHEAGFGQPEAGNNAANGRESNVLPMARNIELDDSLGAQNHDAEYTAEDIRILESRLDRTKNELSQLRNRVDLLILLIAVIVFAVSILSDSSLS